VCSTLLYRDRMKTPASGSLLVHYGFNFLAWTGVSAAQRLDRAKQFLDVLACSGVHTQMAQCGQDERFVQGYVGWFASARLEAAAEDELARICGRDEDPSSDACGIP